MYTNELWKSLENQSLVKCYTIVKVHCKKKKVICIYKYYFEHITYNARSMEINSKDKGNISGNIEAETEVFTFHDTP